MFDNLQNIDLFPATASEVIINISVALICSLCIGRLYKFTHKGPGLTVNFIHSIVMLSMITALVIMVVGNSLARAFGLVGTLSIIRFRTAVKDTQDIVYIFFGLSIGMAAGAGFHRVAFIGTIFIGVILYLLARSRAFDSKHKEYLLQFSCSTDGNETPAYTAILKEFCRSHKVINVKSIDAQEAVELSYYVRFKDNRKSNDFIRELRGIQGVKDINLFFDEEEL
jgi:uncharacterized membrane protein YhiD involved in acid resistance